MRARHYRDRCVLHQATVADTLDRNQQAHQAGQCRQLQPLLILRQRLRVEQGQREGQRREQQ